ncbi:class I SAM-dependent methyltransferase [Peribacillus sp. SCS-155]|uniref:class I SAM-dependent methyltransferase n=1 Tax=Peribacillus sedimenti TaxID=3115297 RepID=UPI003905D345
MDNFLLKELRDRPESVMSYRDYLDAALYHPDEGYYMKRKAKIGKKGDFYTSSNVSDVFGWQLARWFRHVAAKSSLPPVICELGGGTGALAKAILHSIEKEDPALFDNLNYYIIETSPYHRNLQEENLQRFPNKRILQDIDDLGEIEGIIFSNEFFDAFPVHVIEKHRGSLLEVFIGQKLGSLHEILTPLNNKRIHEYLTCQRIELSEGQRFEVPLDMVSYLKKISDYLTRGLLVTIDYGYTNEEWALPMHKKGSLRGYRRHLMISDILSDPGNIDITSHIHFDSLGFYGEKFGLNKEFLYSQEQFLLKAGILDMLEQHDGVDPFSDAAKRNRAIRSLVSPGGISSYFRVMLQSKHLGAEQDYFP